MRGVPAPEYTLNQPRWNGEPIAGKTILLIAEQGLGDTIQFIRYAAKVKALGARVVFRCPLPLVKLCAGVPGIDALVPHGEPLPSFDVYIPLMSLAAVFRTGLDDVPGIQTVPVPARRPGPRRAWEERLGPARPARSGSGSSGRGTRPTAATGSARPGSGPSSRSPPYRA